jgi:hypothetical protein
MGRGNDVSRMAWLLGLAPVLLTAQPVAAASPLVGAANPEALAGALKAAGYGATLGRDDLGDPVLDLDMHGYKARLLFLDCDPQGHDRCDSVQFLASFDAEETGLSSAQALQFARRYRYAAVTLNDSGDPTLRWDIQTGEGIPYNVFVAAAERFLGTMQAMAAQLYPKPAGAP